MTSFSTSSNDKKSRDNDEYVTVIAYMRDRDASPQRRMSDLLFRLAQTISLSTVELQATASEQKTSPNILWQRKPHGIFYSSRSPLSVNTFFHDAEINRVDLTTMSASIQRKGSKSRLIDYLLDLCYYAPLSGVGIVEDAYWHLSINSSLLCELSPSSQANELIVEILTNFGSDNNVYSGFFEIAKNHETWAGNYYNKLRMPSTMLDREIEHYAWLNAGERRRHYVRRIFPLNLISKQHVDRLGGEKFLEAYEDFAESSVQKFKYRFTQLLPSGAALIWTWPHLMEFSVNSRKLSKQLPFSAAPAAWLHERFRDAQMLI